MNDARKEKLKELAKRSKADAFEMPELMDLVEDIQNGRIKVGDGIPLSDCKKRILKGLNERQKNIIGITNLAVKSRGGQPYLVGITEKRPRTMVILSRAPAAANAPVAKKIIRRRRK